MKSALKKFVKYKKKMEAYKAICDDLKEAALNELKNYPDGKALIDDVECSITHSTRTEYSKAFDLHIKALQQAEKDEGRAVITSSESLKATIPGSLKENVLSQTVDYKKHFGIN